MVQPSLSSSKKIPLTRLLLPWAIRADLRRHGDLIWQFIVRDIQMRYRGSYLGICWSLLRPLFMLMVYTVVFGYFFNSKLGRQPVESKLDFTLALFCGLVLYDFFADCMTRGPLLVYTNPNLVTKVVFPLEILPLSAAGAGLVHMAISFGVLVAGQLIAHGGMPWTALYVPVIILPLILMCLGAMWALASLGVFLRDINSMVPVALSVIMFASAIFYRIDYVPAQFMPIIQANPLALIINQARHAMLWGDAPPWSQWVVLMGIGLVVLVAGYVFFMRTKRAFADVL